MDLLKVVVKIVYFLLSFIVHLLDFTAPGGLSASLRPFALMVLAEVGIVVKFNIALQVASFEFLVHLFLVVIIWSELAPLLLRQFFKVLKALGKVLHVLI